MTWAQVLVVFAFGLAFPSICLALWGTFSGRNSSRMSPDEEYRWLTEEQGLSHEEAQEYMYGPPV